MNDFIGFKWIAALEKFYQINGVLSAKIIIYRDGVNDFKLIDIDKRESIDTHRLMLEKQLK